MGRILVLLAVSALVVCSAFALRDSLESFERPKPAQAQTTGDCPSAQLIDTFEGNGDQQTDTFTTTTDSFRVSFKTTDTIGGNLDGSLFVDVINADRPNSFPVASVSQEGSGRGETFANTQPGNYYLDIIAGGLDYTITVEQCEGGGASQGVPPSPTASASASASAPAGGSPIDKGPNENLMRAGGPSSGPLPLMPDGTCPEECPVKRGGACY
jgi:hypothetical protein